MSSDALRRFGIVLFLLLAVARPFLGACSRFSDTLLAQMPKQPGVEPLLADAQAAIDAGRLADAESALDRALGIAPENRDAQLQLGIVYLFTER
jgi:cytochrome c-type biogenesis protein CcmH/NrfG